MRHLKRASSVVGHGFAAWLCAALIVYAADALPEAAREAVRFAALAGAFWTSFSLYYERPDPVHPMAAAVLTLAFLAALDLALIARYYLNPMDLFKSFWDWQLPALVVLATILAAGRRKPAQARVRVLQNR